MPLTRAEVLGKVVHIVAEQCAVPPDKVTEDTNVEKDLSADSLDLVEITMQIEDDMGVSVPDEEARKLHTVRDITDYLFKHQPT